MTPGTSTASTPSPRSRISDRLDDDARALAAELADAVEGEVRFDAGSRATYSTDCVELPPGARSGSSCRGPSTTSSPPSRRATATGSRSPAAAAGRAWPGQCTNVAVIIDFSKYLNRVVSHRPRGPDGGRRARLQPRRPARPPHGARAHLRPRPGHPQPQHPRRHDRQQLLRRPLGDGRVLRPGSAHRRPGARARRPHLRRPPHDRRRHARPTSSRRSSPKGGREGRDLPRPCVTCATDHEHAIRTGFPDIPRRVSGFNLDRLLAERRLRRGQGARRHRGHLRRDPARHRAAHRRRARADPGGARLPRRLRRRRPRARWSASTDRSGSRASTPS